MGCVLIKHRRLSGPFPLMALPITATPQTIVRRQRPNRYGSLGVYFEDIRGPGHVQALPYDRPLPYRRKTATVRAISNPDNHWVHTIRQPPFDEFSGLYSRAYDKFRDMVLQGQRAEIGMNVATAKMTWELWQGALHGLTRMEFLGSLADRHNRFCSTLRNAVHTKNPRKRQYWRNKAASVLGAAPTSQREVDAVLKRQGLRAGSRLFAAEYLAFHYGWSPLIGDLYTVLDQIRDSYSLNPVPIRARSRVVKTVVNTVTDTKTLRGNVRHRSVFSTELGAMAQVSNEVLFVMNRTGLINPATVVWDRVPFSFVADWFGNFSQKLAAPLDFAGVSLRNFYHTQYVDWTSTDLLVSTVPSPPGRLFESEGVFMNRLTPSSIPMPPFVSRNPFSGSWRRAFAQVSLLTLFGLKKATTRG